MALALRELNPAQGVSERHLVTAVRRGDDRAFELLFERYRRRIASYVYGLVRDAGRAEDITQEIFISALRRIRATERPIAFKPWIYEIARNACIDEFRRSNRAPVVSLDDEAEATVPAAPLVDNISPDVAWERREQLDNLVAAFSGLSHVHHRMLVMRELEGLSYTEIADRLGMSRRVVESSLFRARRRLATEYEELASGRQCERVQAAIDRLAVVVTRSPGIRERRRIGAHLRHCDACVRHAREAGLEESLLRTPSVAERIAAILPFGPLPAALRRFATRHGATTASLADAPPALAISRAVAAVAALAVAGVALPSVGHATRQSTTVPAAVSLAPVPTRTAVPLNVAAAQGAEPARTLPAAVFANFGAVRVAPEHAAAKSGHAGARPAGSAASRSHSSTAQHSGTSATVATGLGPTSQGSTGAGTSRPRRVRSITSTRIRSGVSRVTEPLAQTGKTVVSAGSNTLSAAGGAVRQAGAAAGGTVAKTGAAAAGAVTGAGAGVGNTVSQTTGAVGGSVAQAGQVAGAATSVLSKP